MIHILAEAAHEGSFLADYIGLLQEPAHYAFEFTVNLIEVAVTALIARPLWRRYKASMEQRAINKHDARFHPNCAEDYEETLS